MNESIKKDLTCTICSEVQETYSEIVYSQGNRVCIECKKDTASADNKAFDKYMDSKIVDGFHVI